MERERANRWTRPLVGKGRMQDFGFTRRYDANGAVEARLGGLHLRWEHSRWTDLAHPPGKTLGAAEVGRVQRENTQLQVECEVLLHLLAQREDEERARTRELQTLKSRIRELLTAAGELEPEQEQEQEQSRDEV